MTIERDVLLAPYTTLAVGGAASYVARVETLVELQEALSFAQEKTLKVHILGGGSNTLFDDDGFDGLVVRVVFKGISFEESGAFVVCTCAAGESWDEIVARTVARGLWGIENLSGIPGTVGGAVVQNIGAYGAALSEVLDSVDAYDTIAGTIITLRGEECAFGYRDSVFKQTSGRYVILSVALRLSVEGAPHMEYRDLQNSFKGAEATLQQMRDAVLAIRKGKFPDLAQEGTAGSFFKNPIVTPAVAQALLARYPQMPLFSLPETAGTKVPLAWVLDHVLHMRGVSVGSARLFEKQPLVVAVSRGGLCSDVLSLTKEVQEKVQKETGIMIEPEVCIVKK